MDINHRRVVRGIEAEDRRLIRAKQSSDLINLAKIRAHTVRELSLGKTGWVSQDALILEELAERLAATLQDGFRTKPSPPEGA